MLLLRQLMHHLLNSYLVHLLKHHEGLAPLLQQGSRGMDILVVLCQLDLVEKVSHHQRGLA